jgi:hypothetical protein
MSGVFVGRDRPGGRSGIVVFVAMDENDARIHEFDLDESVQSLPPRTTDGARVEGALFQHSTWPYR